MHPMDLSDGGRSNQSTDCSLSVLKAGFLPQASYKKKNIFLKINKTAEIIYIKECWKGLQSRSRVTLFFHLKIDKFWLNKIFKSKLKKNEKIKLFWGLYSRFVRLKTSLVQDKWPRLWLMEKSKYVVISTFFIERSTHNSMTAFSPAFKFPSRVNLSGPNLYCT